MTILSFTQGFSYCFWSLSVILCLPCRVLSDMPCQDNHLPVCRPITAWKFTIRSQKASYGWSQLSGTESTLHIWNRLNENHSSSLLPCGNWRISPQRENGALTHTAWWVMGRQHYRGVFNLNVFILVVSLKWTLLFLRVARPWETFQGGMAMLMVHLVVE